MTPKTDIYSKREKVKSEQTVMIECQCDNPPIRKRELPNGDVVEVNECNKCPQAGVFCAICKYRTPNPDEELDFHHWDYSKNIGVFVCGDCHGHIHSTEGSYPDNDGWQKAAFNNAVQRMVEVDEVPESESEIVSRLNFPEEVGKE